jgi:hypothetical protein
MTNPIAESYTDEQIHRIIASLNEPAAQVMARDLILHLVARLEASEKRTNDLLAAMEPLLVQVEPLRYEQRKAIDQACIEKDEWAKRHNATCSNSNEMWFYQTEFRRLLEEKIEPLTVAVRNANEVYDRINALKKP